jgi:hypothetical protein
MLSIEFTGNFIDGILLDAGSMNVNGVVNGDEVLPILSYWCAGMKIKAPKAYCVLFEPWMEVDILQTGNLAKVDSAGTVAVLFCNMSK